MQAAASRGSTGEKRSPVFAETGVGCARVTPEIGRDIRNKVSLGSWLVFIAMITNSDKAQIVLLRRGPQRGLFLNISTKTSLSCSGTLVQQAVPHQV